MSVCFCIETEEAHNHDDVIYPEGEGEEGAAERVAGGGGARLTWWEEVIGWVAIVPDYATFVLLPTAVIALSIMWETSKIHKSEPGLGGGGLLH